MERRGHVPAVTRDASVTITTGRREPGAGSAESHREDRSSLDDGRASEPSPPGGVRDALGRHGIDLAVAVGLFVLGLVTRHSSLPHDGLIFDDAWVATGAMKASVGELFTVGLHHPAFTALLMGWAGLMPAEPEWMALPAYVGGAAVAPALYLVLRRFKLSRPVSLLVAALVVVAPAHAYYSGRVKTYVIDGLIVLIIACVLPALARRRWGWPTVALWVGAAFLVGTFSVFTLMAGAAATAILALHPTGDRTRRWTALGILALVQWAYLSALRSSFNSTAVSDHLERHYDAFIEPTTDIGSMVRQVAAHTARLGDALIADAPGGNRPLELGLILVALAGLAWEAWRGSRYLVARFLLALPAIAFVGSLVGEIPFGPIWGNPVFPGTRASLWLVPSLALGLAFSLELVTRSLGRVLSSAALPVSIGLVVVAGVVVATRIDDQHTYLDSGAPSAHRFVEERAGDRDVIIVLPTATWHYAAQPGVPVDIVPAPETDVGFLPRLADPRMWVQTPPSAWDGSVEQLRRRVGAAPRVFVLNGVAGWGDLGDRLGATLASLGYTQRPGIVASVFEVSVWERPTS
jgi:hypothetical protein